jgi:hypothetical protein
MRAAQAARAQRDAQTRIVDIVNAGEHFHSAYDHISRQAFAAIPPTLPGYAREYLRGYLNARLDLLWRNTEFRYQLADGSWVNATDLEYNGTDQSSGHWVATHNPPAAHFWKGTDRPFTHPQPINNTTLTPTPDCLTQTVADAWTH